jgi:hypothetical protein
MTTAFGQACVILFLDFVFKPIIYWLTKFENHKTKITFENSYVIKIFLFRFLNNYASIIYIAFAKQPGEGCIKWSNNMQSRRNDCMTEMKYQVIFIFMIYLLQNVFEIGIPLCKKKKSDKSYLSKVSQIEKYTDEFLLKEKVEAEFFRDSYDEGEVNGTVEEYSELMV